MSRASISQLRKRGIVPPPQQLPEGHQRDFTPQEALELHEMNRCVSAKKFEAAQIKGNTALIPRGQEVAAETEAVANLLENAKNLWLSQKLRECGYGDGTKCTINLSTGEIKENHGA